MAFISASGVCDGKVAQVGVPIGAQRLERGLHLAGVDDSGPGAGHDRRGSSVTPRM